MNKVNRAILIATAVCGTLDIGSAFLFGGIDGLSPGAILRFIASGPFGDGMRNSGSVGSLVGLAVHFSLMLIMSAAFVLALRHRQVIRRKWVLAGTAYALAIYGLMYWAVMPARFGINPSVEPWPLGNALFSHIVCVGLPMAYITHRVFGSRSAFAPIQNALPGASATLLISAAACLNFSSPARAVDRSENAIFAGGCFWGVEGVFEHVKGVRSVVSGYAGGRRSNFRGSGGERTDFAEAVRVNFDPEAISYHQLLEIFAAVAHDPTQVNRQGPDVGTRYRSAIFPQNARQRETAQKFLINARASGRYGRPIATRIEGGGFAVAERAHQDYMRKHPKAPYVVINDLPKLVELRRRFPQLWRD